MGTTNSQLRLIHWVTQGRETFISETAVATLTMGLVASVTLKIQACHEYDCITEQELGILR